MRVSAKCDTSKGFAQIDRLAKRMPINIAIAMTKTAKLVKEAERDEMESVFDRPTPYTLNSLFIKPATPQSLEARVWLKDESFKGRPATEYLIPEIEGGLRVEKRSEVILRKTGILPAGMVTVPAASCPRDAYGNVSRGTIQQILSALRASETALGHTSDRPFEKSRQRKGLRQFFVASRTRAKTRHLHPGIWERVDREIKPIIMFVSQAKYRAVFEFARVATEIAEANYGDLLKDEIANTRRA